MTFITADDTRQAGHPMDLVEESVCSRDWVAERTARDELIAEVGGRWCDYHLLFAWSDEIGALQITCAFDIRPSRERMASLHELLALANDRLWVGHFDISSVDGLPSFRHALLLRGGTLSAEQVEDMVDIALQEVDRFYPAFQYVLWADHSPTEALACVMLETVGHA